MYQKKALHALARDGQNIYSKDFAATHRLSATSSTQKAVNHLIESGIIEKHAQRYEFSDPFFSLSLLRQLA